jgi:hypothetical protein
MTADAKLMEALARIEHKLDLLFRLVPRTEELGTAMTKLGDVNNHCPVCKQHIEHAPDINDAVVVRKCGCSTGKVAIDLKAFAPPVLPVRKRSYGNEQEDSQFDSDHGTGRTNR